LTGRAITISRPGSHFYLHSELGVNGVDVPNPEVDAGVRVGVSRIFGDDFLVHLVMILGVQSQLQAL
jgi:hypothetical protein